MSPALPGAWWRLARRLALPAYALALLAATHWPRVTLGDAPEGTDKVLHVVAYALWGGVAVWSGALGPAGAARTRWRVLVGGAAFGAIDEATQALPGLGRHASVLDFGADVLGLALALGAAWGFSVVVARARGARANDRTNPDSSC